MVDKDLLSTTDAKRLEELGIVFESTGGGLLSLLMHFKEEIFGLFEPTTDGSIPDYSILKMRLEAIREEVRQVKAMREAFWKAMFEYKRVQFLKKYGRVKMSPTLEDYIWSSEEGDDQIEFRSPVPGLPPRGQLMVVNSKQRRKKRGYDYCLAACEDGTVRWVHESECVNNGSRVWTVHWFDLRGGGTVYFGDRLQRPVRNVCINFVNNVVNKTVGGNFNWFGTQNIDSVNC